MLSDILFHNLFIYLCHLYFQLIKRKEINYDGIRYFKEKNCRFERRN